MAQVLIVDGDTLTAQLTKRTLEAAHHRVDVVADGGMALRTLRRQGHDLLVMEADLPDQSGYDLCRRIRRDSSVGIIFLSRNANAEQRVRGLDHGADDFLAKPCAASELIVRVGAVLRRIGRTPAARSKLAFDPLRRVALREQQITADLTPRESLVLSYLMQRAGLVCPTNQIASHVWGESDRQARNIVATSIWRLRSKLERNPSEPRHILTVRSVGYRFEP